MNFISFSFAVLYLVALLARFALAGRKLARPYLYSLLLLSAVFYAWHVPAYLALLATVIALHFTGAKAIEKWRRRRPGLARLVLAGVVGANLLVLAWFKYADFLLETVIALFARSSGQAEVPGSLGVLLPVAISFFTFQTISYSVDVWRGRIAAEKDIATFALYVAFFPQLVAGPIVRAWQFLYQARRIRPPRLRVFQWGAYLVIRGLFFKLVLADNIGIVVDAHWDDLGNPETPAIVLYSLPALYAVQLLCDFMGYTDIARGLAYPLGFRLPVNFSAPYIARTFAEFWHRWHITLSRWFRDYLYIPLGGGRASTLRTVFNITLVFAISGLWHGAGLNFVVWGLLLGAALVIERIVTSMWNRAHARTGNLGRIAAGMFGFVVVQGTWVLSMVFFRSADLDQAVAILDRLFDPASTSANAEYRVRGLGFAWWCTVPVALHHLRVLCTEHGLVPAPVTGERWFWAGLMLALTLMLYADPQPFIYFRF